MLEPLQSIPRFLSFIELTHLYEAAKAADEHLASKLPSGDTQADINMRSYINSTRQSLLRAIFLSSYGVIEQNIDELVIQWAGIKGTSLTPSDLSGNGVKRSLQFAKKVLGKKINLSEDPWKKLLLVQLLRNHLIHYGPDFAEIKEHDDRIKKFSNLEFVTISSLICFTTQQLESLFSFYLDCLRNLQRS